MRKYAPVITGTIGFFIAAGAGGGIEQDTMGWAQGLAWMALGFAMMWGAAIYAKRRAR